MKKKLAEVDVVLVGLGWTGGILAKELSGAGLKVVALERGVRRTTENDFSVPRIRDELRYQSRNDLMQNPAKDTLTVRNKVSEEALPMRRLGAFLPGEGVGGAGVHWNGHIWRWTDMEFKILSRYKERYGSKFIPEDMTVQDWGISYADLEPYYDKFEYMAGVSGKAGNIRGKIQSGGNPFEAPRAREYPLPPLRSSLACDLFKTAANNAGYHPFPRPVANSSQAYTNPDGVTLGACQYCGFCERFGCEANAKASPHITVIPLAERSPNFELRTQSWVTKVLKDSTKKQVTGVEYTDIQTGEEFVQPARIVILCAYAINNVHLMLLSEIGQPYNPETQTGVIGKNYCYQILTNATLFFEGKFFNPFMSTGGLQTMADDFYANWNFDRGPLGYVGGATLSGGMTGGRPISYRPVPSDTPKWGKEWKVATAKWYNSSMNMSSSGSVMPNRSNYYDLDPGYRNSFNQPLLRMTFDYKDNEHKISAHMAKVINDMAKSLNPTKMRQAAARSKPWSVETYATTHNTGGTIMGTSPSDSAVNNFLQSWDCHNLFVMGSSVFPHNSAYNPTGLVGALAYRTADVIKNRYLKNPGPLV